MVRRINFLVAAAFVLSAPSASAGPKTSPASMSDSPTAQLLVNWERRWAEESCTHQPVLPDLLADDFYGTSPRGTRYDKAEAIARAAANRSKSRDCRLLTADVHFFGETLAVVFGSESAVEALPTGEEKRACLIWTDTWLRRGGKWQIIAVQDAPMGCPKE